MKFGKIFKIFKKGSKAAQKRKGQKASGGFDWPSGVRIGVYGHTNAGKTVYFTVLNEECKIARDLQLSVTDNATAGEFLTNYRSLWGLGTTSDVGTVVDLRGEKKFPEPTQKERVLLFNAILDGSKSLPIVTCDYPGAAISISEPSELKEKITDFMDDCDGLLFFFDSKILQAELQTQAHVASLVNMLERLAPLGSRLPIPAALVVTKADILDGFVGEEQNILITPEDENLLSESYELFLEKLLSSPRISSSPAWSGSVRNVLVKLREFLKVVVGRTLDFQIFFTSCTGTTPAKIGSDVGRSIYKPPEKMSPAGVKEPFKWLLNSIVRNRRISRFRAVAKFVAVVSLVWIILFSIPCLFHFMYLLPKAVSVESNILETYNGNFYNTSSQERTRIISAFSRYERSWTVKWLFPEFLVPSGRLKEKYGAFNLTEEIKRLDQVIDRFTGVVNDPVLWPKLNPSDTTIIENEEHQRLRTDLDRFHQGDSTAVLFKRSDRVITYWDLFLNFISHRGDSSFYNAISEQAQFNARTYGQELSASEKSLGEALSARLKVRAEKKVQKEVARKAAVELDDLFDRINGNSSPAYRLGEAVTELRRIRKQLDPAVDGENIAAIRRYLRNAEAFEKRRKFTYKVESVPAQGHLHIEVTASGKDPAWSELSQIIEGFNYSVQWKLGDEIHIALDTLGAPEDWGKKASDRKILKGRYALFNMDGEIFFDNLRQKITIRFSPPLSEMLPELKK